jgi:hypothetical protein
MIDAKSKRTINGMFSPISGSMKCISTAMQTDEITRPITERIEIDQTLSTIFLMFILNADSNISVGKKT